MIEGIYNNAASLTTLEKWQASITQNLVASKVAGFKKSNFAIESDDKVKTSYNPEQSAARHTGGLPVRTTSINFTPGEIEQTQKPTDIAIDGPGFFQIQGADGNNLYTRNGEFQFNNENTLVTRHGLQVMGDGGPITIFTMALIEAFTAEVRAAGIPAVLGERRREHVIDQAARALATVGLLDRSA
jgi:flagellar hook-basal body protein